MGNSKSTVIKEEYETRRYRIIIQHTDPYIGPYQLIKFTNVGTILYLRTTIEPIKYDHYNSNYDLFSSKMQNMCKNICGFEFLNESAIQSQAYDLVFEFGNYINSQFQKEEVIWEFINGIMEGLAFLQAEGLHYPVLRKKYTTYVSDTNTFKLLNPFCFTEFVDKAIGVYFNCDVDLIEKADYSRQCINRNVKEFAIMILALIKNVDESQFIKNPTLIKPAIKSLRGVYSDDLVNLLAFIIRSREMLNFIDLRNFLEHSPDRFFNSITSKDSLTGMSRKTQLNDTRASLTTHHSYSDTNLPRGSIDIRQQYNESKVHASKNYSSTMNIQIDPNPHRRFNKTDDLDLNSNQYQQIYNENTHNAPQNIFFRPDNQDHMVRVNSAVISDFSVSQKMVPSPRIDELESKEDLNTKGHRSDIQDLRGLHKTIQDISNVGKIAKSSYHEALEKKAENTPNRQEQPKDVGIIETHKDSDSRASLTGQHRNVPKPEPQAQSHSQPPVNKKVKRLIMKWIASENKHKEFVEYEDGTLEEKTGSDAKEIKSVIGEYHKRNEMTKSPVVATDAADDEHKPKKSAMHFDVRTTIAVGDDLPQIVSKNNYNIILFGTEPQEPPKVIFTSSINRLYTAYDFMKGVVDHKNQMRVSKYHQDIEG